MSKGNKGSQGSGNSGSNSGSNTGSNKGQQQTSTRNAERGNSNIVPDKKGLGQTNNTKKN